MSGVFDGDVFDPDVFDVGGGKPGRITLSATGASQALELAALRARPADLTATPARLSLELDA